MKPGTILWHDYETSGIDSRTDRPLQFGAIRTTEDLTEIGEPIVVRARLSEDVLPDPEACLVTRVVPGDFADEEVSELEFARTIAACMNEAGTCVTGYNSIRFDDEFTRFLFWRCLLPVYDREWRNGNSRWDLIDVMRAAHALRPEGMEWPERDGGGAPSFRLSDLAAANGLDAADAHDALADVRMTIALAQKVKRAQPKLYDFLYQQRTKASALGMLREAMSAGQALVHVSGKFRSDFGCASVVAPVMGMPRIANQIVTVDLRHDPAVFLEVDPEQLRECLYTRRSELPEDAPRVGLKTVHANRAPVIAPLAVLDEATWERVGLVPDEIESRRQFVEAHRDELIPVLTYLCERESFEDPDEDAALYGGFLPDGDLKVCRRVHKEPAATWRGIEQDFADPRLSELLFRLRCREAPETLDDAERQRWNDHIAARFSTPLDAPMAPIEAVRLSILKLREIRADAAEDLAILDRVEALVNARMANLEG